MKKIRFKLSIALITFLPVFIGNNVFSQEKTGSEMLQAKEWTMQIPDKLDFASGLKFTPNKCISIFTYQGQRHETPNSSYYLSDEIPQMFDQQKVGCVQNGKYVVVNSVGNHPESARMMIYEIIELTDTDLQIRKVSERIVLKYKNN